MLATIFALLVIYQVKHFLADFALQTPYMFQKGNEGWSFIRPLMAHCGVHASFTCIIAYVVTGDFSLALLLAGFDFSMHFVMDRLKSRKKYLGRFKVLGSGELTNANREAKCSDRYFWLSLGLDQAVHHVNNYAIIAYIVWQK